MNPSANGWVKKTLAQNNFQNLDNVSEVKFYNKLRATGFVYGCNVATCLPILKTFDFTQPENCKLNLLLSLYYVYKTETQNTDFITSVLAFYKALEVGNSNIFNEFLPEKTPDLELEKLINKRIYLDDNIVTKNFNHQPINLLLFIYVLAYKQFLKQPQTTKCYTQNLENTILNLVFKALKSTSEVSKYQSNFLKWFQNSLRYSNLDSNDLEAKTLPLQSYLEKHFALDMLTMALWNNDKSALLLKTLNKNYIKLSEAEIETSKATLIQFYNNNFEAVSLLDTKNFAQSFYDNTNKIVSKLITRNSKRLIKELAESKEAMYLLAKSTQRSLTETEQKKVQAQLLDIFKSIPSLAIFLLPGGMLLLPIVVKLIPKLLPSAFDDNRLDSN